MAEKTFIAQILIECSTLIQPLIRLDSSRRTTRLFADLGWRLPVSDLFPNGFVSTPTAINDLLTKIQSLADAAQSDNYDTLVNSARDSVVAIISVIVEADGLKREITAALNTYPQFISNSRISDEFPARLLDFLLYDYLRTYQPKTFAMFNLIGVCEKKVIIASGDWEPASIGQQYSIYKINWERLPNIFTNPADIIKQMYKWDEAGFDSELVLKQLKFLANTFFLPAGIYHQSEAIRTNFRRPPGDDKELRVPLYQAGEWPRTYLELDLNVSPLPGLTASDGSVLKPGLAIYPFLSQGLNLQSDLSDTWSLSVKGNADLEAGFGFELRPPGQLKVFNNLFTDPVDSMDGNLEVSLTKKSPNNELTLIFGSQTGSRLGYKDISINVLLGLKGNEHTFAAEININDLTLVVDGGNGDGFIKKILSGIKLESISDLTLGASNKEGFYFKGSAALMVTIPVHKQLGPIFLENITVGVGLNNEFRIILATTFSAELGPLTAAVKDIGLEIPITFPADRRGNFGPVNIDGGKVRFLPPSGAGLALNTEGISGGGYLECDKINKQYAGVLALKYGKYSLTAVGLITTVMPDGSSNFSLMINIGILFDPAIQLPYNFSLSGVGGLLGVNRTVVTDVLRDGLRARTLDSILFPEDPIQNAPRIISDMRSVFPPANNRFIIAPMAKIGWGKNIITADICVLIELPSPVRILLLAQVNGYLPKADSAVVELHLDALGVLDFARKRFSFDATLYDSRIQTYTVSGDAAIRMCWGTKSIFAMSLGGFNPGFTPPPGFPSLSRLKLSLADYDNLDISCTAYHAITSNTLQFGSRVSVHAEYSGATLDGHMGFEALLYFSPFSFSAKMEAGVSVAYKGFDLASVDLELTLSGPNPWRAKGKARFSVSRWDVEVDFDKDWGSDNKRSLPDLDPLPRLRNDLREDSSWGISLEGINNYESHVRQQSDAAKLILHPAGLLEVREKTLPLGLELDLFANADVANNKKFVIKELLIYNHTEGAVGPPAGLLVTLTSTSLGELQEDFAIGQFHELNAQDKLSKPSFQKLAAGAIANVNAVKKPTRIDAAPVEFENILIDSDRVSKKSNLKLAQEWKSQKFALKNEALRYQQLVKNGKIIAGSISVSNEGYRIVNKTNMGVASIFGNTKPMQQAVADQVLKSHVKTNPADAGIYQVVPEYELIK